MLFSPAPSSLIVQAELGSGTAGYTREYEGSVEYQESNYHYLELFAGQLVQLTVIRSGTLSGVDVSVYDVQNNWVTGTSLVIGYTLEATVTLSAQFNGVYRIEVVGALNPYNNGYKIKVSVTGEPMTTGKTIGVIVDDIRQFSNAIQFIQANWNSTIIQPPYTADKIRDFKVIAVFYSNYYSGDSGEAEFTQNFGPDTIEALVTHVQNGKGLLVEQPVWDHANLNVLLSRFNITVKWGGGNGDANGNEIYWAQHPIFNDIKSLSISQGNGICQTAEEHAAQLAFTFGDSSFLAAYQDVGRVISITTLLHASRNALQGKPDYFEVADNALLMNNIMKWLLGESLPTATQNHASPEAWTTAWTNDDVYLEQVAVQNNVLATFEDKLYASLGRELVALNIENGNIIWRKQDFDNWLDGPIYVDDKVFVKTGNVLYAINPTNGNTIWNKTFEVGSQFGITDIAGGYGKIFLSSGSWLYSVDVSDGRMLWKVDLQKEITACPLVANNKIVVGCEQKFFALDTTSGAQLWSFRFSDYFIEVSCAPVVSSGSVFFGAGGTLYALNENDGSLIWKFNTGDSIYSSPVVVGDSVYVYSDTVSGQSISTLFALSKSNGYVQWFTRIPANSGNPFVPTLVRISEDEVLSQSLTKAGLALGTRNKNIMLIDEEIGESVYERQMETVIDNMVFSNGYLIIVARNSKVYALKPSASTSTSSPIPDQPTPTNSIQPFVSSPTASSSTQVPLQTPIVSFNDPVSIGIKTGIGGAIGGVAKGLAGGAIAKLAGLPSLLAGGVVPFAVAGAIGGAGAAFATGIARNAGWGIGESIALGTAVGGIMNIGSTVAIAGLLGLSLTPIGWGVLATIGIGFALSALISWLVAS
jgi:outer membrane protein assembly factor BamB